MLEDREADAELVRATFARQGINADVVRTQSRTEFTAGLRSACPSVVLCDNAVPGFGVVDAVEAVRTICPGTPVVVLSGAVDERRVATYIRAGVEDIVLKHDLDRLTESVGAAIQIRSPFERLSPRQRLILRLIAEGQTTPGIARHLKLSEKTVGTHRVALMRRLGIHDVAGLVRYAVRLGVVRLDA
jgi:DNA-binding NarL/FixJ family response regulator